MYFEKVPFEQYKEDYLKTTGCTRDEAFEEILYAQWLNIKLPSRATTGSAGYDFYLPDQVCFKANSAALIPTGVRVNIDDGWFLMLLPRSGLGFKYGMRLENTCGVIDSDYYHADNLGHIMAKISADRDFMLEPSDRFMQGLFVQFGTVNNEDPTMRTRTGGFGSTGN